jgi:hypothetical protein
MDKWKVVTYGRKKFNNNSRVTDNDTKKSEHTCHRKVFHASLIFKSEIKSLPCEQGTVKQYTSLKNTPGTNTLAYFFRRQ